MSFPTHRFTIGSFTCTVICDNIGTRSAVSFWPSVPADEVLREVSGEGYDPDALKNSINILLIQTSQHLILVDTSLGEGRSELLDNLQKVGVEPESIDRVIITHGHGDHIGGIVRADGSLVFPNARYSMWRAEWEHWLAQGEKADNPNETARRNLPPIRDRVDLVDHESEILPGICALPAPGHTLGHMALLLESDGESLLHIVDAAHHPIQVIHTDWSPSFDMQPDVAATTRRALFERAARENLLVLTYHFAFPGLGHIVDEGGKLKWQEMSV